MTMAAKGFARRNWRTLAGAALGALCGGLYAHFVGCRTGTCMLTSNVWVAAIFFGFTGAVAFTPSAPPREPDSSSADASSPLLGARPRGAAQPPGDA